MRYDWVASCLRDALGAPEIGPSEVALNRAASLLSAIVESSDDAIISKDLDGIVTSWNRSAERLFGYTADEAVGRPIVTLVVPADRQDEEPKILARLKNGERVHHFETIRRRKDGSLFDVSLTISPVRDVTGDIIGASKIARDITDEVRNRKALSDANAKLMRSNADLEHFAYSASHDLQEPLRMVSTYAALVRKKFGAHLGPAGDQYIEYILEGARRMERLLHDLRAFTQASADSHSAPAINAQEVLERTLANLKNMIAENQAQITFDPLPMVNLPEFQLEQLFQNVIGNAIRYRSAAPPRIHE